MLSLPQLLQGRRAQVQQMPRKRGLQQVLMLLIILPFIPFSQPNQLIFDNPFDFIILTISPMILQKLKRNDQQNKSQIGKSVRPYSILSLPFLKNQTDSKLDNRSRQITHGKINQKENTTTNNQNTHSMSQRQLKEEKNITSTQLSNSQCQIYQQNIYPCIPSATSIQLPAFNDTIIQKSIFLKLENLTNQMEPSTRSQKIDNFPNLFLLEEEKQQNSERRVFVDMKKKIKKLSHSKKERGHRFKHSFPQISQRNLIFPLTSRIYSDSDVIIDGSIFRNKLISQRIDNDVDTDDEQIASGIRRLQKSLAEAVEEHKWEETKQKILNSIEKQE